MVDEEILEDLEAPKSNTEISKCPSCGGGMEYDPITASLKCVFCGNDVKLSMDNFSSELDFADLARGSSWSEETRVLHCTNCGAKSVLLRTEIAKQCPYCGTSNVVETNDLSGLKPNAVLPFALTAEQAILKVVAWAKKKFFAPGKFKKTIQPENVRGNYSPAFTFDTQTVSGYEGRLGKHYYVTVGSGKNRRRVRRTRYFRIHGTYSMAFDDVLIQASSDLDQKTIDGIAPFDTNNSQAYSTEFLHGFTATQHSKDGTACWASAKQSIYNTVKKCILNQYDHDVVDYINVQMSCNNITYKYVLLPIYVGHNKYMKKIYNFFVNGQSGKVTGKTPLSWIKITLVTLLGVAIVGGIGALIYFYGG